MPYDIGPVIGIEGEKEFKKAINDINKDISVLASEMEKSTAAFADNADSVEALTEKQDVLGRQLLNQKEKVETLRAALKNAANELGESDTRTKNWQISLNKAEAAMVSTQNEINKTTAKLKSLENAEDDASDKGSRLRDIFKGGFAANIASQAMGALISMLQQATAEIFETADKLMVFESETGLTIAQLQQLQYIGDDVGVSIDDIAGALGRLTNNMQAAQSGSGAAYDAFTALGVSFQDSSGQMLSSTAVFDQLIDALGSMANETERDALAQDLLGKSAKELNPLIEAGTDSIRQMADEARKTGSIMSDETVQALDFLGDSVSHTWQTVKSWVGTAYVATIEFLTGTQGIFTETGTQAASFNDKIKEIQTSYDASTAAAQQAISKQMGLWQDMSSVATKSYTDIKSSVESQIQYLEKYNISLFDLSMRNVEGIDELVKSLSDGSTQSAEIVSGLAAASDTELKSLIDRMGEVKDRTANLSRQMGQIKTDANSQLNELYNGMRGAAEQQLNASDAALKAGMDTMQGYINGIKAKQDEVVKAFSDVAKAALKDGHDKTMDRHSPSRVMGKAAEDDWTGFINTTMAMQPDVISAFQQSAASAAAATQTTMGANSKVDSGAGAASYGVASSGTPAASGGVQIVYVTGTVEIDGQSAGKVLFRPIRQAEADYGQNLVGAM